MGFLYALEGIRTPLLDKFFSVLTLLGGESVFIAIAVIVFWCWDKRRGYYLVAVGVAGTVVNQFLKIVCRIPRPWERDPNFTIVESARSGASGYSFPSGHSQNAVATFGGLARSGRGWMRWFCIVLAVLVCFSRLYLGVHTPLDVGVGLLCGLALVLIFWPIFAQSEEKPQRVTAVFGIIAAAALSAVLYLELHAWPADVNAENLYEARKNGYTMLGIALAALVSYPLERRYIHFETKAPFWAQILKCVLGIAVVMGLRLGLKAPLHALFGQHLSANTLRYFLVVVFAIVVWPATFPWFARGCRIGGKAEKNGR